MNKTELFNEMINKAVEERFEDIKDRFEPSEMRIETVITNTVDWIKEREPKTYDDRQFVNTTMYYKKYTLISSIEVGNEELENMNNYGIKEYAHQVARSFRKQVDKIEGITYPEPPVFLKSLLEWK